MTYTQIYALRNNSNLIDRTAVAVAHAALYCLGQNQREAAAKRAIEDPRAEANRGFMWAIADNGDVQTQGENVADSVIQFVVDTYYPEFWPT